MFHYNSIERAPTPLCSVPQSLHYTSQPSLYVLNTAQVGATHFMLHIAGSGALNNPFNPPIIDRETAICPVPGTAQTNSGVFVGPKDRVGPFFLDIYFLPSTLAVTSCSLIFSILIFSIKKLPTLGQSEPALQQTLQNRPTVKRAGSFIMRGQTLMMGFWN